MNKRETQANRPKKKKIDDYEQSLTSKRWPWEITSQEKKKEEDSPALRIVLIHQYKDLRNTLKRPIKKTNYSSQ